MKSLLPQVDRIWRCIVARISPLELLLILWLALPACSFAETAKASDLFKPTRRLISVSFKEHFIDLSKDSEERLAEYWASRGTIGLSFKVTTHFGNAVSRIFLLYPDADPFIMRWILLPEKSICYKNTFSKKDYPFDPHLIPFQLYWHRLIDNLYKLADGEKLTDLGEEEVAGYRCKKVAIGGSGTAPNEAQRGRGSGTASPYGGPLPETGWMVWYSPELDLLLRIDKYEYGKQTLRQEASDIKEGRLSPEAFRLPPGCSIKTLSIKEFDALDVARLSQKN